MKLHTKMLGFPVFKRMDKQTGETALLTWFRLPSGKRSTLKGKNSSLLEQTPFQKGICVQEM